jgi:Rieske Fe-S protein
MMQVSRRAVLAGACAGCATVALTACGGGADTPAAASATSAAPAPSTAAPLALLADIPVGTAVAARTADGKPVLVTRTAEATAVAFSAVCTHQGCTVEPAGPRLGCPCHDSVYDAATGAVLGGPAPAPLTQVPVAVRDGAVVPA